MPHEHLGIEIVWIKAFGTVHSSHGGSGDKRHAVPFCKARLL